MQKSVSKPDSSNSRISLIAEYPPDKLTRHSYFKSLHRIHIPLYDSTYALFHPLTFRVCINHRPRPRPYPFFFVSPSPPPLSDSLNTRSCHRVSNSRAPTLSTTVNLRANQPTPDERGWWEKGEDERVKAGKDMKGVEENSWETSGKGRSPFLLPPPKEICVPVGLRSLYPARYFRDSNYFGEGTPSRGVLNETRIPSSSYGTVYLGGKGVKFGKGYS